MEEHEKTVPIGIEVARAFERFWDKNELSIDKHGRIYRTTIPRVRPKGTGEFIDFRKPETKKKAEKNGEFY